MRPRLLAPSLSSTMRAGGVSLPPALRDRSNTAMDSSEAYTASPMAVDSCNCRDLIADVTVGRSSVGDTSTLALPPKDTSPRLIWGGRLRAKSVAACLAASMRVGSTSVACIDSETSMAIITVARSRGTLTSAEGRATPTLSTDMPASSRAKVRCRRQPGRRGATLLSSSTLENRAVNLARRNCSHT